MSDSPTSAAPSAKLPLPAWIKLWTERGVDMRMAMAMAGKLYTSHPTLPMLSTLTLNYLINMPGIFPPIKNADDKRENDKDKDLKRVVGNALRSLKEAAKKTKQGGDDDGPTMKPPRKRRRFDPDPAVANPLIPLDTTTSAPPSSTLPAGTIPAALRFHETHDLATLRDLPPVETNRAPVMTAWALVIAERMGFDRMEALSLASVFTSITSTAHALALGNIYTTAGERRDAQQELDDLPRGAAVAGRGGSAGDSGKRQGGRDEEWEQDPVGGNAQPWVGIMGRRLPVIQLADGSWRGLTKGRAVEPEKGHAYISRAFRSATPHVVGALRLLAKCFSVDELNERGYGMYVAFRPEVRGWGEKGALFCSSILDLIPEDDTSANASTPTNGTKDEYGEVAADTRSMGGAGKPQPIDHGDDKVGRAKRKLSDATRDSPLTDVGDEDGVVDREDVFEGLDEAAYDDD